MNLLPNSNFNFMSKTRLFFFTSLFLLISTVGLLTFKGINYGIDFSGGILIEVKVKDGVTISDVRKKISSLKRFDSSLQEFGSSQDILIRSSVNDIELNQAVELIINTINEQVLEFRRVEIVGPVIGEELKKYAFYAVIFALLAMMMYIWIRFEWQYGVGALIALFHDVLITIGFVSLLDIEFGLSVLAAILTIAGYSINDTVVIFDRVRENFSKHKKKEYEEIFNLSINQSLNRTIMTSLTTLVALITLYLFGGEVISGFTLAMIIGVVIGTYSSNFVAVPVLLLLKPNRGAIEEFIDPVKAKFFEKERND